MTEPLLLLHGAPGDGRLWQPVIEHVISDVEVITPTLSYFGDSIWPDDGRGFGSERHADDIVTAAAAAAAAKGRPVRLVLWSYSVLPGLLAALRRPELFTSILAYEPGLPTWVEDQNELARFGADATAAFGPIADAVSKGQNEDAIALLFDASGGIGCFSRLPADRKALYLQSSAMMPLLMGGGEPPTQITSHELAGLKVPLIVAMGSRTRPVFEIPSRGLAKAARESKLRVIEDADHMLPETAPTQFAALIDKWIAGA